MTPLTKKIYESESLEDVEADQRRLESGELPKRAEVRLNRTTSGELPWMSTYSIPDFVLVEQLRIDPLAQVTGACYFHAATDNQGHIFLDSNLDAANLVRAYYRAKDDALERLIQEASAVGAHAVLNARYRFRREGTVVSFTILGTAVRFLGLNPPKRPLISPLSGEETYKLLNRGWLPVSIALGYHWHCMPVGFSTKFGIQQSWYNQEFGDVTDRFMESRQLAIRKMRQDGSRDYPITGFVGVKVDYSVEETEIVFMRSGMFDNGINIGGAFFPYDEVGKAEVPAYNTEFFATGASIVRLSSGKLSPSDIAKYLLMT
jgi:uncharacterized protein YbjQ (UPF0145 family)